MTLEALRVKTKENKITRFNSKVLLINNYENIFELKNLTISDIENKMVFSSILFIIRFSLDTPNHCLLLV